MRILTYLLFLEAETWRLKREDRWGTSSSTWCSSEWPCRPTQNTWRMARYRSRMGALKITKAKEELAFIENSIITAHWATLRGRRREWNLLTYNSLLISNLAWTYPIQSSLRVWTQRREACQWIHSQQRGRHLRKWSLMMKVSHRTSLRTQPQEGQCHPKATWAWLVIVAYVAKTLNKFPR